jgi:4-hydroxy-2-oxoheptanedioate aldolase
MNAFGTDITLQTPAAVEVAALAGFDFIRLDAYHVSYDPETLENMVRAAYSHGITPWVRCRNVAWDIMTALDRGAQALTIPMIGSADEARAAVRATFYPPKGNREMSRPLRFRNMPLAEYIEWSNTEVLLCCQIEGRDGLEHCREIAAVPGVDCIQTGRGDLSMALGILSERDDFHPAVLEAEERIVLAALEAGKEVCLPHPLTSEGIARTVHWITRGVRIHIVDSDYRLLMREYAMGLRELRTDPRTVA